MGASSLPPVPGDIRRCINRVVPKPSSIKTKKQVARLIAQLRRSNVAKTRCGRRLLKLYDSNRAYINSL